MNVDTDQNKRIGRLEERLNLVENDLTAIKTSQEIIVKLCRGLIILAGVALGVDVIPMMEGM